MYSSRKNILCLFICFAFLSCDSEAQKVSSKAVKEIINTLASDDMQGRKSGTKHARKAANFIANKFKKIGLKTFQDDTDYLQSFDLQTSKSNSIQLKLNNKDYSDKRVFFYSNQKKTQFTNLDQLQIKHIENEDDFNLTAQGFQQLPSPTLYLVSPSLKENFQYISKYISSTQYSFENNNEVRFVAWVLDDISDLSTLNIQSQTTISSLQLSNVIGVLPGKSKADEYVVYSAHYDHIGVIEKNGADSIANGADDDASGVAAVISLAQYFKEQNNNERSIIFVCFTGEEMGLIGSSYFSKKISPQQIVAGINIEMIGKVSKFGKNEAFLTGYERSDLGDLLNKSLSKTTYKIHPDPYTKYRLFYRSDNASMAKQGIPAHTISTSQIDNDKHYHAVSDEIETLNIKNIVSIIDLIAQSSQSLIRGEQTPKRISKQ